MSRYSLRGRYGNYSLVLQAQDSGNPPLHTTSRFHVCVTDVNDNSPVFVKPPQNYTIRVLEVSFFIFSIFLTIMLLKVITKQMKYIFVIF